jgi:hypothetical protein
MLKQRKRKQTLLGEAFDMKDSAGWQDVADSMHIQEKIAQERRILMQRLALGVLLLLLALVILYNCL